jgi:dnd system-associated protein 4
MTEETHRVEQGGRIYVQRDKHQLFQALGKDDETSPFPTLKDAFLFAAAVGWANGRRVAPRGPRQHVGFWHTFTAQQDVPLIQAICIAETGDPAVVANRGEMLKIVEEYANGGIDMVVDYERHDRDATVLALASLINESRRSKTPAREP